MCKYYLTYALNMANTKELYYISVDENTSTIKAKNAMTKVIFPRLMELMNITDVEIINKYKSDSIKSIKKSIYDSSNNTLEGYTSIEVTGNIDKTDNKVIIKSRVITDGQVSFKEVEGEKHNSKLLPNMDLYIVKHYIYKGYYYIIDANSGLSITSVKTKNNKEIEIALNSLNMSETEIINKINSIINPVETKNNNNKVDEIETNLNSKTVEVETTPTNETIDSSITETIISSEQPKQFTHTEVYCDKNLGAYECNQKLYSLYENNLIKPIFTNHEIECIKFNNDSYHNRIQETIKAIEWNKHLMLIDRDLNYLDKLYKLEEKLIRIKENYLVRYQEFKINKPVKKELKYKNLKDVFFNYIGFDSTDTRYRDELIKYLLDSDNFEGIKKNYAMLKEKAITHPEVLKSEGYKQFDLLVNKLEPIYATHGTINSWMQTQVI